MDKETSKTSWSKKTVIITVVIAIIVLAVGIVFAYEYRAYTARKAIVDVFSDIGLIADTDDNDNDDEEPIFISSNVGDVIQLTTIDVKINGYEEVTLYNAGEYSRALVARAGTKFIAVDLSVTNTTKESFTPGKIGAIIDSEEREYLGIDEYYGDKDISMITFAPGITENGIMLYEVPDDASGFSFTVGKAGTNEIYQIKLK